jgi:choline dehydrogenase-like flavoprotein
MLSGIGPAAHLRSLGIEVLHDAPGVGGNLQDHPDFIINRRAESPDLIGFTPGFTLQLARAILRYSRDRRGLCASNIAEAGGFLKTLPELDRPDVQLHFLTGMVDDHNRKPHLGRGYSCHVCVLRPASRGTVRLASTDPMAAPLIDPAFLEAPEDMATLVRGVRLIEGILAQPPLARLGGKDLYPLSDDDAELEAIIRTHADSIYHPVGTCRMGGDPASVVDPTLSVRGLEGLSVADASVMPTLIGGNTQAPSAMIGERAADFLLAS